MVSLTKSSEEEAQRMYVARAELVLARPDHRPLARLGPDPDPLQKLAAAMAAVRSEDGELADVVVDLVPVPDRQVDRRRRALMRRAEQRGPSAYGERIGGGGSAWWDTLRTAVIEGSSMGGASKGRAQSRVPRQVDLADGVGKFVPGEPVFAAQVLLRVEATHPARARALLHQLLGAMEVFSGENRWRPVGPRWGAWRAYSNTWWRRRAFDRRFDSGEFAPARRQWVTPPEIAGLLKPPTRHCDAMNVARTGGVVPPAPAGLPEWTGQRGLLPLGQVTGSAGRTYLAGVPERDVLFGVGLGKSGFGKTEQALLQFLAMAYCGYGCWFLDPHGAALERSRAYLTHPAVRNRVWEVDLAKPALEDMFPCWNPLDMSRRRIEDIQEVVGAVVGAIATAQGWGDGAPRARTILSNAVLVLAHLAHQLVAAGQPQIQPTLLQVKTLLTDEVWRAEVLEHMPDRVRKFWRVTFPKYEAAAVPTITNALDLLETSLSLTAFLGGSVSSYDVRRAMDTGAVVTVAPSGTGAGDNLISSLLIFDLFMAGLSRQDTPTEQRRTFFAWMDELAALDSAGRGFIAKIFEQLRKYKVRLMVATQMAMRLSDTTRQAALQNQSVLSATAADIDEARFVAARMPGVDPETIAGLDKYQYIVTAQLHGRRSTPFRVSGVPIDQVMADYYDPAGLPDLESAIDLSLRRQPVHKILAHVEFLDEQISDYLATRAPQPAAAASAGSSPVSYDAGTDPLTDTLILPVLKDKDA
ncbi:putative ATP/GTP-binding protein (plasmid) [Actinacidiphila reveromycinica]|uniref:Putative ATP/GTP-binding protein n=1 Tax=Actinacidiphila reveromycinica TaxID=659352 RepID=A0A7R6T9N3_9ACTN|nr:ATP/GTP-binding protein [Streptomyces sp. SN-593]BBG20649.1 putative ATP/GTP-binding protein [Streptomyces sp. SN-593]